MIKEGMGVGVEELGGVVGVMGELGAFGGMADGDDGVFEGLPGVEEGEEEYMSDELDPLEGSPELPEDEPSFHAPGESDAMVNGDAKDEDLFDLRMDPANVSGNQTHLTEKRDTNATASHPSRPHRTADNKREGDEETKENQDAHAHSAAPSTDSTSTSTRKTNKPTVAPSKIPATNASRKTSSAAVNDTTSGSTATTSVKVRTAQRRQGPISKPETTHMECPHTNEKTHTQPKKPSVASLRGKTNPTTQARASPADPSTTGSTGSTHKTKTHTKAQPPRPTHPAQQPQPPQQSSEAAQTESQPPHKRQKNTSATGGAARKRGKRYSVLEKLEIAEREARRVSVDGAGGVKGVGADVGECEWDDDVDVDGVDGENAPRDGQAGQSDFPANTEPAGEQMSPRKKVGSRVHNHNHHTHSPSRLPQTRYSTPPSTLAAHRPRRPSTSETIQTEQTRGDEAQEEEEHA